MGPTRMTFLMDSVTPKILNGNSSPAGGSGEPRNGRTHWFGRNATRPAMPTAYPPFTAFSTRPLTCVPSL